MHFPKYHCLTCILPGVGVALASPKLAQSRANSGLVQELGSEGIQIRFAGADGVPSPLEWDTATEKARAFTSELQLEEKIRMVTGDSINNLKGCVGNIGPIPRLNFTGLCYMDGPQAVNRADGISVFPSGVSAGATWDRDLIFQRGVALGEEFKLKGAHVMLGPVSGPLGRHPLGGRNWEGFSADPYLAGQAMKATIQGGQSVGVQTCSKHYIGNEQETQRSRTTLDDGTIIEGVSSNIDDRTLHEIYLWPFADAIKAGTTSIMCSYNRVNQTYACASEHLLTGVLRDELGFRGYVVSDWWATHGTAEYANGGLDMEMPGAEWDAIPPYFGANLSEAVASGEVLESRLDEMVTAIMTPFYLLGQDSTDYPAPDPALAYIHAIHNVGWDSPVLPLLGNSTPPAGVDVRGDHASLIRKLGAAGTVLLKNEGAILPFSDKQLKNIGVFGNDAVAATNGLAYLDRQFGFEFGTLDIGGGSGTARHLTLVSPLDAIRARAAESGTIVQYITSNTIIANKDFRTIYPLPDICIVFVKSWASEGSDRLSFEADWNSTVVVNNIADFCTDTIVVTHSGGVNTMPWADHPNIKAILAAHLPGEETGNSLVDILWGDAEPSGRLPYTIPKTAGDYDIPVTNLTAEEEQDAGRYGWQANFTEGLLIDYHHFDALDIEPLYEFGFGLSYATFELAGDLKFATTTTTTLSEVPDPTRGVEPGGNPELWDELLTGQTTVRNTGSTVGATVVQLYVSFPADSVPEGTPPRVLRGFEKAFLEPREARVVTFPLTRRDLSYWNVERQAWQIPQGDFTLQVGFSSRDLKDEVKISLL